MQRPADRRLFQQIKRYGIEFDIVAESHESLEQQCDRFGLLTRSEVAGAQLDIFFPRGRTWYTTLVIRDAPGRHCFRSAFPHLDTPVECAAIRIDGVACGPGCLAH